MTFIVGMNFGDYVLIGADTRVTKYLRDGTTTVTDDRVKVRRTMMGLIAGTGLISLLDGVTDRLASEEVRDTRRIIDIIREEREKVPPFWLQSPRVRESLEHETAWFFSYLNGPDVDSPEPDTVNLRLALSHPHDGYELALYPPNSGSFSAPLELGEDNAQYLQEQIDEHMAPRDDIPDFNEHVGHHVRLFVSLLDEAAGMCNGISTQFQIGLQTRQAGLGISEISTDGKVSIQVRSPG